jgi:hypothetical protein
MTRRRAYRCPDCGEDHSSGPERVPDREHSSPQPQPPPREDPFVVLGLQPTLDVAPIKQAYFAALSRHPPHRDPLGFQRLRAAYEQLMEPSGLAAAYLASPPDLAAELARYRARFDAALVLAAATPREAESDTARASQFIEQVSRMSWDQALAALGTGPVSGERR